MANLEEISASGINNNFTALNNELATKANLNGDSTQVFNVADAVTSTEAISKGQLGSTVAGINSFASLDTSNMPTLANNATVPNTQIDFNAGFCFDDTLTKKIVSTAMTKRLDATFSAGTGNGGLDTGSKAINTWYHCFAIAKADGTSDFLFSASFSNPTMPSEYIYKRRIGCIKTNNSGNIISFCQKGDYFTYDTPIQDLNMSSGFPTSWTNYTISVPPNTRAIISPNWDGSWNTWRYLYIKNPSATNYQLLYYGCPGFSGYCEVFVNASSQISLYTNYGSGSGDLMLSTLGYIDFRGKN